MKVLCMLTTAATALAAAKHLYLHFGRAPPTRKGAEGTANLGISTLQSLSKQVLDTYALRQKRSSPEMERR